MTISCISRALRCFAAITGVFLILTGLHTGHAAPTVTLAWDANTEPNITGYRLHYRTLPGQYTAFIEFGKTTKATVSTLPPGNYFAALSAVSETGESEPSNEVSFTITPGTRVYGGLVESAAPELRGLLSMVATPAGVVTGRLRVGKSNLTFKGRVDANGQLSILFRRRMPLSNLALNLTLAMDGTLTGTLSDGVSDSTIATEAATFAARTNEAPQKGKYTVVLRPDTAPAAVSHGLGVARLTVSKVGVAQLVGSVSDGSRFTLSSRLTNLGHLSIFVPLYNKLGCLFGTAAFRDVPGVSDADGSVSWYKPGIANPVANLTLNAARYQFTRGVPTLSGLTNSLGLARISFTEGSLPADIVDRPLTVSATNLVTALPPNTERITFAMASTTGTFSGRFVTLGTAPRSFRGVLYQKGDGFGVGWFTSTSQDGYVEFRPAD